MSGQLHWLDHAVIVAYVAAMMALGWRFSRRQQSDEEYFLGGRSLPWFAVGISVIASLLSSITYLSEPGGIWRYGFASMTGRMIAIPLEMLVVFLVFIPFFVRFRFTTAYEYLEHRYDRSARLLGAAIFLVLVTAWMGVIVLVSSRALVRATGLPLELVIVTIGFAATIYTLLGGIRAVVWTDVIQVALLVGGGIYVLGYVGWTTASGPSDWVRAVLDRKAQHESVPFFSFDPIVSATTITFMLQMFVWHVCTHSANQMTLQRYFSTGSVSAARRSFVTAALLNIFLTLMLTAVGTAMVYYYTRTGFSLPPGINLARGTDRDSIFPLFVVSVLPPGVTGAIFAALLAAAMSTIDSGVNSFATVWSLDIMRRSNEGASHVREARVTTFIVGVLITFVAIGLDHITGTADIISMLPKTFNCFLSALGGMFIAGMFLPRVGTRAIWPATLLGLAVALGIAFSRETFQIFGDLLQGPFSACFGEAYAIRLLEMGLGFTWVLPISCAFTVLAAWLISLAFPNARSERLAGLTWHTRAAGVMPKALSNKAQGRGAQPG